MLILLTLLTIHAHAMSVPQEETFPAEITAVQEAPCEWEEAVCNRLTLRPLRGTYQEKMIEVLVNPQGFLGGTKTLSFEKGDRVLIEAQSIDGDPKFVVADFVRTRSLTALAILFLLSVLLLGGFAALRSLVAMILSIVLLLAVLLPAILHGVSPLLVAVGGGMLITVITMLVGHGWHPKTLAALGGIILSLFITCVLAILFTEWSKLSGLADEHIVILFREGIAVNTQGILLAGFIIGTLGVLDDMTIAQASAVFELRAANTTLSAGQLYRSALRIGSDHIAAGVNTLILAYAGTALPLLLIVASDSSREGIWTLINREVFATEIVRALVGSIGLLAAVPLSTAIACFLAVRMSPGSLGTAHGHRH